MNGDSKSPIHTTNFDPVIEVLEADLSVKSTEIHFNIAVGPKTGLNIGLPQGSIGIGVGAKLDVVRVDLKLSEYESKSSLLPSLATPQTKRSRHHLILRG